METKVKIEKLDEELIKKLKWPKRFLLRSAFGHSNFIPFGQFVVLDDKMCLQAFPIIHEKMAENTLYVHQIIYDFFEDQDYLSSMSKPKCSFLNSYQLLNDF